MSIRYHLLTTSMAGGLRSSPIPQQEMADQAANTSAKRNAEETQTLRSKLVDQHISMRKLFGSKDRSFSGVVIDEFSSKLSRSLEASSTASGLPPRHYSRDGGEVASDVETEQCMSF